MGKKSKPPDGCTPAKILLATQEHIGSHASRTACATAIAAGAGITLTSAQKILRGGAIRQDVARRVAALLATWGCAVAPGDIAMGSEAAP